MFLILLFKYLMPSISKLLSNSENECCVGNFIHECVVLFGLKVMGEAPIRDDDDGADDDRGHGTKKVSSAALILAWPSFCMHDWCPFSQSHLVMNEYSCGSPRSFHVVSALPAWFHCCCPSKTIHAQKESICLGEKCLCWTIFVASLLYCLVDLPTDGIQSLGMHVWVCTPILL